MSTQLIGDEDILDVKSEAFEGKSSSIYYFIGGLAERNLIAEAVSHVSQLVALGYLDAYGALAEYVYSQDGPSPNETRWKECMCLYSNSDRPGHAEASFKIAVYFERKGEIEASFRWFLESAQKGYIGAAIVVGYYYLGGKGVSKNLLQGARWFMRSLEMEFVEREDLEIDLSECELTEDREEDWPVDRKNGWRDWRLFGEMFAELSFEDRLELTRIVSKQV